MVTCNCFKQLIKKKDTNTVGNVGDYCQMSLYNCVSGTNCTDFCKSAWGMRDSDTNKTLNDLCNSKLGDDQNQNKSKGTTQVLIASAPACIPF